jgi:hypothetical protein
VAHTGGTFSNYQLLFIDGADGKIYDSMTFSSASNSGFTVFPAPIIQRGTDGLALLNKTNEVIEFLSYEGIVTGAMVQQTTWSQQI